MSTKSNQMVQAFAYVSQCFLHTNARCACAFSPSFGAFETIPYSIRMPQKFRHPLTFVHSVTPHSNDHFNCPKCKYIHSHKPIRTSILLLGRFYSMYGIHFSFGSITASQFINSMGFFHGDIYGLKWKYVLCAVYEYELKYTIHYFVLNLQY